MSGNTEVNELVKDKTVAFKLNHENLLRAQAYMKIFIYKHYSKREFAMGVWFIYAYSLVALHRNIQLAPWFYGPYPILEWIDTVGYKRG